MLKSEVLVNKNFPMVFHGIFGADIREKNSPSYFNKEEIDVVFDYVKILLKTEKE